MVRVVLLLTFGLPVLAAQALVARVEVTPWVFELARNAEAAQDDGTQSTPVVEAVAVVARLFADARSLPVAMSPTVAEPEGSSARALLFVKHVRRQAS
ncbi:MAG: hypothetical protein U0228_29820 [Myxococcaceae bacterium]